MFEFMRSVYPSRDPQCPPVGSWFPLTHGLCLLVAHRLKIARLPAYPQFIQLGKEREGALFLDMGCCCGSSRLPAVMGGDWAPFASDG